MKKVFVVVCLLPTMLFAKELPIIPNVNCDNVKLSMNTIDKNNLKFGAYWKDEAIFPNPPRDKSIGNINNGKNVNFSFTCPNFSVKKTENLIEVKSTSYDELIKLFWEHDQGLDLYHYSFYAYPNIRQDLIVLSYEFNIKSFDIKTSIYTSKEGDDLDEAGFTDNIPRETVIGYKVNGGDLKPLLYDRKISHYKNDFHNASIIDIYHKMPVDKFRIGASIERIYIDKEKGILRIYRKSNFPSK